MPVSRARAMLSAAQVERQADELVAQGVGDELVDLVADLARHAADDRPGAPRRRSSAPPSVEGHRVQEGVEQASRSFVGAVGVDPVDVLGQHRVPEPVDDVGELGARSPGRCRRCSRSRCTAKTSIAGWILRANSSKTRCWYCISVTKRRPGTGARRSTARRRSASFHVGVLAAPGRQELRRVDAARLDLLDQPVVLGVEDVVDGRQADVLVAAPSPVMKWASSSLVVVGRRVARRRPVVGVGVAQSSARRGVAGSSGAALWAMSSRNAWPVRATPSAVTGAAGLPSTPMPVGASPSCGEAVRAGHEACRTGRSGPAAR